jgi:tetratricopeptide (TPR) repeat protein
MLRKFLSLSLIFISLFLTRSFGQNTMAVTALPEAIFNRAEELIFNEKYSAALDVFNLFIQKYPENFRVTEAFYYQAFCHLMIGNPLGELEMKDFVIKFPTHPKANYANYDLGCYAFKNKKYMETIQYLTQVNLIMLDENNKLECNFKLGYAYMNTKEFAKAGAIFLRLRSTQNKYTYASNYYLGYINYKNGLYEIAEQNLKKAAENVAYQSLVPQVLINVYEKQKKYDTLIAYTEKLMVEEKEIKNVEEIYLKTAEAYYQKKDYTNSVIYFEKIKTTGTELTTPAIYRYAFSLYKTGKYNHAIEEFKKINETNDSIGQNSAYYLALSWLKIDNKLFAFNSFNQVRNMSFIPELKCISSLEYGELAFELHQYNEVIISMREFLQKYPDRVETLTANALLSKAYLSTNDYKSAIEQIESIPAKNRTEEINNAYQIVCFYHGKELFNLNKYQDAVDFFEKSARIDSDKEINVLATFCLAESQSALRKYEEAILNYKKIPLKAFKTSPELIAKNYYGLGYAYFNSQLYANALPQFKDFLDESKLFFNKNYVCDATLRLADCFLAVKNYKEAHISYQKVIDFECENLDYPLLQRGIALGSANKENEAKANFKRIINDFPQSIYFYDAIYHLGLLDFENTNYEASIEMFSKIIDDWKSETLVPLALQKRALVYNNLKQYNKSVEDYQMLINGFPNHPLVSSAIMGLQAALSKSGKVTEVDSILQTFKSIHKEGVDLEKVSFEKAKDLYFNQQYEEAIPKFVAILEAHTNGTFVEESKYFLADSYLKMGKSYLSIKLFEEIVKDKSSNYYNKAILKLADLYIENKDFHSAKDLYENLLSMAKSKKETVQAWSGLMQSLFELKSFDSSQVFANKIIESGFSTISYTNKALLMKAKNALEEEDEDAENLLINCFNDAEDQNGAEAMFLLAKKMYVNKKYHHSLEILFDLNIKFVAFDHWVSKSFLLMGDNYVALKENYQAKATYSSLIGKAKDDKIIALAKEKLANLENK